MHSKFIVIEGLEGSGKTTAAKQVIDILKNKKKINIILTREPGGTPIAEKLRYLIKNKLSNENITNIAELFMIYAARSELVDKVIKPSLEKGIWVVSDRHDLSSQAYQGGGRNVDNNLLKTLRNATLGNFRPDLTLYLDVYPCIGLNRIRSKRKLDRIERESLDFFKRVRSRYKKFLKNNKNVIIINANQSLSKVKQDINKKINTWVNEITF